MVPQTKVTELPLWKMQPIHLTLTLIADDLELELRLARLEDLMDRRPLLLNSVLLRQNPHNVHEWHKRVQLYEGKPTEVSWDLKLLKSEKFSQI